jgi:phospholipid N-methyltransferase
LADILVFLRRFFSEPGRIGSIVPSSRYLCKQMLKQINWSKAGVIVELGPGTGVFTQAILRKKRADSFYFVVERDPHFRAVLRTRFPRLVVREEAVKLSEYVKELGLPPVDVIVSGLPFANFPEELRTAILDEILAVLAPNGLFITFQYSLQLQSELEERFSRVDVTFTPLNIPPAFIYTCRNEPTESRHDQERSLL